MMKHRLERKQQLNCDIHTAWEFFSSPHNLARITPAEMKFKVLKPLKNEPIFEGQVIEYRVSPLLGISVKWVTRITQVDHGRSFTDFQEKGPYKLWSHFHEFIPNSDGVLMRDTVDYELPFGFLGELVHRLVVRKKLNHIFNHRFKVLENVFGHSNQPA